MDQRGLYGRRACKHTCLQCSSVGNVVSGGVQQHGECEMMVSDGLQQYRVAYSSGVHTRRGGLICVCMCASVQQWMLL